ncbi:TrbG/VirB9 family P-type conjugative transfer protein [Sphingomonas sp.]|uniref:TrbG/VirB9 family P-type conjugative transfer protein n=1 Tax=Sphingomonas sp. TaxID=28214 RepID=UPI003B005DB6
MKNRLALGLALASDAAMPLAARADPRIAVRPYQAAQVVVVHGRAGVESTIAFADDERIENVAVGNSAAWQVTPNKRANLLFVKPTGTRPTNMTVVTDQRTYLFDLVAATAAPVYMLRFSYPPKPAVPAPRPTPEEVALAAAVAATAAPPASPPPDPAALNFAWNGKGDKALLPARVYDDGKSIFLSWDGDVALPAILVRDPSGQEGPVNYTVRGGVIVVDGVPPQLVLRAGKQVATLSAGMPAVDTAKRTDRSLADARPSRPFAHVADGRP